MLADELDYVVGVDPHRDRHAVAVVRAPNGQVLMEETEPLRECCRLQSLRGWSHVRDIEEVFTGGS